MYLLVIRDKFLGTHHKNTRNDTRNNRLLKGNRESSLCKAAVSRASYPRENVWARQIEEALHDSTSKILKSQCSSKIFLRLGVDRNREARAEDSLLITISWELRTTVVMS